MATRAKPRRRASRSATTRRLPKVCVDKVLSIEDAIRVGERAISLRPDNAPLVGRTPGLSLPPRVRMAIAKRHWPTGSTLKVAFLEGHPVVQRKVEQFAKRWEQHANVRFDFGTHANADIRIAFDTSDGSWSYVGLDNTGIPRSQPTMNYGWLEPGTDDREYERVVVHEFGHALGCIHEHQNPNGNIPWDREKVYAYYRSTNGWDRADVDSNVFQKYSTTQVNASEFDPHSIMLYAVPNELTIGDFEIGWNTTLSENDKRFIAKEYPRQTVPATGLVLDGPATAASIGAAGEVDRFAFSIRKRGRYVVNTTGKTDVVLTVFGPNDPTRWRAEDDDSGIGRNARIALTLEPGEYVAQVRHYASGIGAYGVRLRTSS